ncbi:YbjQ family protein [Palleronia sp. KMU-117]|uniref:YbjQ family protein n=1 Tax=Palleronia sp. KMU-117 TaxID=3434108 RepID=UPI003D74888A
MTASRSDIIALTTETVPGREIERALGLVRGSTVRAKHIGSDIVAGLRNLVGGEVKEYAALLAGAREQAYDRMIEDAARLGADAVVAVRMETSTIQQSASEVVFYGTAVRLK